MANLSKKMKETLVEVGKLVKRSKNGQALVHSWHHNSWESTTFHEGLHSASLDALERRGLIKIDRNYHRRTGVYNPVADSWGYSIEFGERFATLTGKGKVALEFITEDHA